MSHALPNFDQAVLPHLDAAYNLARWLTRNTEDAEDVDQEACLRAFRFFPGFRGEDGRAWLMKIVRNACIPRHLPTENIETPRSLTRIYSRLTLAYPIQSKPYSKMIAIIQSEKHWKTCPLIFGEILILREFEEMSYREIVLPVAHGTAFVRP